jgi:two-component system response regulator YesN
MHNSYSYPKELLSEYKNEIQDFDKNLPKEIKKCSNYILENLFEEFLTISEVKSACNINGKFPSRFSVYTGFTPQQFITYHRIEASKILLKKTNLNISQISALVGYSSHSAYCKTFKNNNEGVIPSVWREKNSGKNSG